MGYGWIIYDELNGPGVVDNKSLFFLQLFDSELPQAEGLRNMHAKLGYNGDRSWNSEYPERLIEKCL